MKITEYPSVTELDDDNVFLLDGTNGTKKIAKSDLTYALFDSIPSMHSQLIRGKNLGTVYTTAQQQAVQNGTFHDLWIGDYWTEGGIKYYIVDINYYKTMPASRDDIEAKPDANSLSNHLILMASSGATNIKWHSRSGEENVPFANSTMYTVDLPNYVANGIPDIFKNYLVNKSHNISAAMQNDRVTGLALVQASCMVPTVSQILGIYNPLATLNTSGTYIADVATTRGDRQFAAFQNSLFISNSFRVESGFWTRDLDGPWGIAIQAWDGSGMYFGPNTKDTEKNLLPFFIVGY